MRAEKGSGFTEDDVCRLSISEAWQDRPEFVEVVCLALYRVDPHGCCSPMNPHERTEYLYEVERFVGAISAINSKKDAARVLEEIFLEAFDGEPSHCDWNQLADALWPVILEAKGGG